MIDEMFLIKGFDARALSNYKLRYFRLSHIPLISRLWGRAIYKVPSLIFCLKVRFPHRFCNKLFYLALPKGRRILSIVAFELLFVHVDHFLRRQDRIMVAVMDVYTGVLLSHLVNHLGRSIRLCSKVSKSSYISFEFRKGKGTKAIHVTEVGVLSSH